MSHRVQCSNCGQKVDPTAVVARGGKAFCSEPCARLRPHTEGSATLSHAVYSAPSWHPGTSESSPRSSSTKTAT